MLAVNIRYQPTKRLSIPDATVYEAIFSVAAGQCLGIMGASGAGKTTLLHAIAGLIKPVSGQIRMDENVWFDDASRFHLGPHQRPVGLVFQEGRLFPHMTVAQNLSYGMPNDAKRAITMEEVLQVLAIKDLLRRAPSQLSGGERQRVALGRALLRQPDVLLMDEPLSGLDADLKQQVLPFIQQVIQRFKLPTIYVSHAKEEIDSVADQVRVLAQGVLGEARPASR